MGVSPSVRTPLLIYGKKNLPPPPFFSLLVYSSLSCKDSSTVNLFKKLCFDSGVFQDIE